MEASIAYSNAAAAATGPKDIGAIGTPVSGNSPNEPAIETRLRTATATQPHPEKARINMDDREAGAVDFCSCVMPSQAKEAGTSNAILSPTNPSAAIMAGAV